MKSRSVREEAVRLVLLLAGLCVAHLGVTLFLQTDLGSDPFNVFVQGLFRFLPRPGFRSPKGTVPADTESLHRYKEAIP